MLKHHCCISKIDRGGLKLCVFEGALDHPRKYGGWLCRFIGLDTDVSVRELCNMRLPNLFAQDSATTANVQNCEMFRHFNVIEIINDLLSEKFTRPAPRLRVSTHNILIGDGAAKLREMR